MTPHAALKLFTNKYNARIVAGEAGAMHVEVPCLVDVIGGDFAEACTILGIDLPIQALSQTGEYVTL